MSVRSNRIDWLVFFALGFMWGSSYLFIKLAVDDFGTFTLVALRLLVGAALLWIVVRIAKQPLPRERRIYGHLLVMAIINITIPFLLITWAEQSVESSLAAILTSPVPLFAIVLSAIFLPDEPMRVNGVVGLVVGFIGVVIITSRGLSGEGSSVTGELALLGAAFSYACGAVYSRRNVRGPAADDPGRLPGHVRGDHHGRHRAPVRAAVDGHAGRRGDLLDPVARDPRFRAGLPARLPAVRRTGARRARPWSPT